MAAADACSPSRSRAWRSLPDARLQISYVGNDRKWHAVMNITKDQLKGRARVQVRRPLEALIGVTATPDLAIVARGKFGRVMPLLGAISPALTRAAPRKSKDLVIALSDAGVAQ